MNQRLLSILVLITIVLSACFWSSLALNISPLRSYNPLWLSGVFIFLLLTGKTKHEYSDPFEKVVLCTLASLYFSIVTSYVLYNQGFVSSFFNITQLCYGFLLYFVLKKYNTKPLSIIKCITFFSVVWVVFEIGQQFTYPTFWFSRSSTPEMRMGLYRYYIWGVDFVMIAMCYWWGTIMKNFSFKNKKLVLLCIILAAGLMCYCSRKHIYATLLVVALSFLSMRGKYKVTGRFCILAIVAFLFYNYANDFIETNEQLIEMQGGEGEDFIRMLEFKYFTSEFLRTPFEYMFGVGIPELTTSMGQELERLKDMYGFYQSDIGVFGFYTQFGFLGIVPIVMYIFIFLKNWRYIDNQYRYFFLMKMLLIVFDFWAMWGVGMVAWALFMYLVDQNIKENKEKKIKIALI